MRYRVLRDLGDSDYPVGSIVDPATTVPPWNGDRVARLVEQRYLEREQPVGASISDAELAEFRAWRASAGRRAESDEAAHRPGREQRGARR